MYRNDLYVEFDDVNYYQIELERLHNQWLKECQEVPPGNIEHTNRYHADLVKLKSEVEEEIADLESFTDELKGFIYGDGKKQSSISKCSEEAMEDINLRKLYVQRMKEFGKPVRK